MEVDIQSLKQEGFSFIVSLLTAEENQELDLVHEASLAIDQKLQFFSFPIVDRAVPSCREEFEKFTEEIHTLLQSGGRGYFHCRAGLGRAPLLGCAVLVLSGKEPEFAWAMIEKLRGHSVPDTAEQRAWIQAPSQKVSLDSLFSELNDE